MLVDYKVCPIAIAFASDKKDLQSLEGDLTKIMNGKLLKIFACKCIWLQLNRDFQVISNRVTILY